jgi:hypothetical protein
LSNVKVLSGILVCLHTMLQYYCNNWPIWDGGDQEFFDELQALSHTLSFRSKAYRYCHKIEASYDDPKEVFSGRSQVLVLNMRSLPSNLCWL